MPKSKTDSMKWRRRAGSNCTGTHSLCMAIAPSRTASFAVKSRGLNASLSRRASVGRSWPAWASGTKVPTTAVLTTPAQKKAKAFFCLTPPALLRSSGDAPKAGQLRPTLAFGTLSLTVGKGKKHLVRGGAAAPAAAAVLSKYHIEMRCVVAGSNQCAAPALSPSCNKEPGAGLSCGPVRTIVS